MSRKHLAASESREVPAPAKGEEGPEAPFDFRRGRGTTLLIACGALAREAVDLIEANGWRHLDLQCLPAKLHHRPELIPEAVREKIRAAKAGGSATARYMSSMAIAARAGELDRVLAEEGGVTRIGGPHCFSFYRGNAAFAAAAEREITAFYLTDYFCRHFETFVWEALGLDRRADMVEFVFANYEKLVYLAQVEDPDLATKAEAIARRLKLAYEYRPCGYGDFAEFLEGLTGETLPEPR